MPGVRGGYHGRSQPEEFGRDSANPKLAKIRFWGKWDTAGGGGRAPGRWISPIRRAAFPFSFLFSRRTKRKIEKGGGGLPLPEFPYYEQVQRSGETKETKMHFPFKSRESSQTVGERGPNAKFRRGQRPSMPASYLPSARQVLRIRVLSIWYQVVLQRQAFFPARHKKNKIPRGRKWQTAKNPGIPVRESCV